MVHTCRIAEELKTLKTWFKAKNWCWHHFYSIRETWMICLPPCQPRLTSFSGTIQKLRCANLTTPGNFRRYRSISFQALGREMAQRLHTSYYHHLPTPCPVDVGLNNISARHFLIQSHICMFWCATASIKRLLVKLESRYGHAGQGTAAWCAEHPSIHLLNSILHSI